ncbi:ABC-three component system protein [Promicromonospora sp. NPDC060271]|uniref:ABC-three component system protein n=1 Tax=Promicromonospora sp. NPDC060271 TaxID=3347089 RepID=UPI0036672C9D
MTERTVQMPEFDASASALGYIHQLRWGLLELLQSAREDQSFRVTLEMLDDVAIEDENGKPLKAVQLKHHGERSTLTDMGVDFWKTLRVWLSTPQLADADGPHLVLVTTADIAAGSAGSLLGTVNRDLRRASELLTTAATASTSDATKTGRALWIEASPEERIALLARMRIVGMSPRIEAVDDEVRREISASIWPQHLPLFLDRLYGWWESACIKMLLSNQSETPLYVSGGQLYDQIRTIRDDFTADSLPVDLGLGELSDQEIEDHYSKCFVEQLKWINVHGTNLRKSIIDYHRAYAQTTRWLQDGNLVEDDLARYERELRDEWAMNFEDMCDRLEADGITDDSLRRRAGRELFQLLRESTNVAIRKGFSESFLPRGTRHMMSDRGFLGWHPDFEGRVKALIGQDGA